MNAIQSQKTTRGPVVYGRLCRICGAARPKTPRFSESIGSAPGGPGHPRSSPWVRPSLAICGSARIRMQRQGCGGEGRRRPLQRRLPAPGDGSKASLSFPCARTRAVAWGNTGSRRCARPPAPTHTSAAPRPRGRNGNRASRIEAGNSERAVREGWAGRTSPRPRRCEYQIASQPVGAWENGRPRPRASGRAHQEGSRRTGLGWI